MRGVIFTGGEGPSPSDRVNRLISGVSVTVAADSGIELAMKFGITPDYIIGDMDSAHNAENIIDDYPKDRILVYDREKDFTDTELAVDLLREKGCNRIIIVGGSGGRADHFLGIYSLFFRDFHPILWIMKDAQAWSVAGSFSLDTEPGETISLFPVTGKCRMKSRGLKWELDSLSWRTGDAGISNVAEGKKIDIEMESGRLVLLRQ